MGIFRRKTRTDTIRYGTLVNGERNTIHASEVLDIEVDDDGHPTAVWFRCLNLPFTVWRRDFGSPVHINPGDMRILNIEFSHAPQAQLKAHKEN